MYTGSGGKRRVFIGVGCLAQGRDWLLSVGRRVSARGIWHLLCRSRGSLRLSGSSGRAAALPGQGSQWAGMHRFLSGVFLSAWDTGYFNFEWNPLGVLHLGFGKGRNGRVHPILEDGETFLLKLGQWEEWRRTGWWYVAFQVPSRLFAGMYPHSQVKERIWPRKFL